MIVLQSLRFILAVFLLIAGLWALFTTTVGVNRLHFVLNRLHVASKCDTLGILLVLSSMMIMSGLTVSIFKLLLLVVFLWFSNPVSNHLIAYLEVATNSDIEKECKVIYRDDN